MKGDQPKRPRGARGKKKGKAEDLPPDPIDTAASGAMPETTDGSEDAPRPELPDAEVGPEPTDEAGTPEEEPAAPEEEPAAPAEEPAAPEEPAGEPPVTSIPPPPESSEQVSVTTPAPAKGKRAKKAPAAKAPKTKGKRGKDKGEPAPPESSKKLVGETETEASDPSEDTWHGSDPEATVNLRGELADLFPLRDDDIVLTETDEPQEPAEREPHEEDDAASDEDPLGDDGDDGDEPTAPESAEAKVADPATTARDHLRGLIEALVFASDKPLSVRELSRASEAPSKDVKVLLEELRLFYKPRGIQLDEVAGGFVFRTNAVFAPFVRDLTKQKPVKLTRAQLETLAILAYRQPITRPEIDDIRGVDSGPVLKMLLERDLVRILGKKDEPGRPLLYGSTPEFLEFFGLKSLKDLPTLQEFTELNEDSKRVAEKELGESFDDLQTLLDHGEEEAAPEAAGTGEAHDTEIPPAFADPEVEEDWDGPPSLDAAESEAAADTDAPDAPAEASEEEEPEPPTQDQNARDEDTDEVPEAPAEQPGADEDDAPPSAKPGADDAAPEEEEDYDDDDFEDDDDDDDDDDDEEDEDA